MQMFRFKCAYCNKEFVTAIKAPNSCPKCHYKTYRKPKLLKKVEI